MRELTPEEVAAMWLYSADYARSGLSAVDWWQNMLENEPARARVIGEFAALMRQAFIPITRAR